MEITKESSLKETNLTNIESKKSKKKLTITILIITHLLILSTGILISYTINKNKTLPNEKILNSKLQKPENGPPYDITQIPSEKKHTHTLFYIHGLTSSPLRRIEDIIIPTFPLAPDTTKVVMLCAPRVIKDGKIITSWFDVPIPFRLERGAYNFTQLLQNSRRIIDRIFEEAELINNDFSKIFLYGHSQGAIMSMYIAHNIDKELGGVIMSSGVVLPEVLEQPTYKDNHKTKFLVTHGTADEIISFEDHKKSMVHFKDFDNFEWKYYEGAKHDTSDFIKPDVHKFIFDNMK